MNISNIFPPDQTGKTRIYIDSVEVSHTRTHEKGIEVFLYNDVQLSFDNFYFPVNETGEMKVSIKDKDGVEHLIAVTIEKLATHTDWSNQRKSSDLMNTEHEEVEEKAVYGPSKKLIVLAKNSPFDKNNLDWIEDPVLGKQYSIDSFEIDVDSFTLNKNKLTLPLLGFHADNECELIWPSQVKICNPGEIGFSLYFGPNNDAFFSIRGAKKLRLKVLYEVLDTALTYKARQVYAYIVTAE